MLNSQGRFVWHDLVTSDTDAAASFYTQVTPWKTQPGDYDPKYTMWVNDGQPLGGFEVLSDELKARTLRIAVAWRVADDHSRRRAAQHRVEQRGR
jgi:uncharacterized protein